MSATTLAGHRRINQSQDSGKDSTSIHTLPSGDSVCISAAILADTSILKKGFTIETPLQPRSSSLDWLFEASSAARTELAQLFEGSPIDVEAFEGATVETRLQSHTGKWVEAARTPDKTEENEPQVETHSVSIRRTQRGFNGVTAHERGQDTFRFYEVPTTLPSGGSPAHPLYFQYGAQNQTPPDLSPEEHLLRQGRRLALVKDELEAHGHTIQQRNLSFTVVWTKDQLIQG